MVVQTPEITQRVHHATDEEKLASTGIMGAVTESHKESRETEFKKTTEMKKPTEEAPATQGMFSYV